MITEKINNYLKISQKIQQADLVLKNCNIINVFSKEVITGDIAICDGTIVGIGDYSGKEEIDMEHKYVAPGLIDSHVHIESTMVSPIEFGKVLTQFGTTTVIADPHEIANVSGLEGIEYMIQAADASPLNIYYMLPSCVPCTNMETNGAILDSHELRKLANHPRILGLGEVMNYEGVIHGDEDLLNKLNVFSHKIIDGHAPGVVGDRLMAYALAGVKTDHECSTAEEAINRIRLGMTVQIRQGSAADNLKNIVSGLIRHKALLNRCVFCTDDKHLEDILLTGHINHIINQSIELGIDTIEAICMATLYPAQLYNLRTKGALAPGYDADLIVFDSLSNIQPTSVMSKGHWQYFNNHSCITEDNSKNQVPQSILSTVHCNPITSEDLKIHLNSDQAVVIGVMDHEIVTKKLVESVSVTSEGHFTSDKTYSKIISVERHQGTGNIGKGIVKNFNIHNGAIAQTISHDSHNILCIGDNDADMVLAVNTLIEKQGGIVVVSEGKVMGLIELPIGGLMSTLSVDELTHELKTLIELAYTLNVNANIDPFLTLAFLALPVIPDIKITDKGLFDVVSFRHIDINDVSQ